jgi:hypothetical protein
MRLGSLEQIQILGQLSDGFFANAALVANGQEGLLAFAFLSGEMVLMSLGGEIEPLAADLQSFGAVISATEQGDEGT